MESLWKDVVNRQRHGDRLRLLPRRADEAAMQGEETLSDKKADGE